MMLDTQRTRIIETAVELQRLELIHYKRGLITGLDRSSGRGGVRMLLRTRSAYFYLRPSRHLVQFWTLA
jgi:hypothetical protein